MVLSSPVSLSPWTRRAAKFPTVGTTVPTTGLSPGSGSATFMCPAMWWRNMAARLSWLATLGRWMASQIWDTNNHRVLLALTSYHMNQQCILIPYTKVSPFSLGDVLRQELPNLASFTFCKTSLYHLSSLQGDESQRWSVVLLGRRTCCLAGIEIPCGQWTTETEREREKRCHLRVGPDLYEEKRKQHAEKMRSLSIHLYPSFCQTSILKKKTSTFWLVL